MKKLICIALILSGCSSFEDRAIRSQNDCSFIRLYCSGVYELQTINSRLYASDGSYFGLSNAANGYKAKYKVKFKYFNHNTTHIEAIEEM